MKVECFKRRLFMFSGVVIYHSRTCRRAMMRRMPRRCCNYLPQGQTCICTLPEPSRISYKTQFKRWIVLELQLHALDKQGGFLHRSGRIVIIIVIAALTFSVLQALQSLCLKHSVLEIEHIVLYTCGGRRTLDREGHISWVESQSPSDFLLCSAKGSSA